MQAGAETECSELLLEPGDVGRHLRPDVRVQADRGEPLVLPVLRDHLARDGEKRFGELLAHDLRHPLFVHGVEEREEEADAYRLDARRLEAAYLLTCPGLVERDEDGAVPRDPLGNGEPIATSDDGVSLPGKILIVGKVERLLVSRDVEDVPVALGRDHPNRCAVVLDHDIRGNRGAVKDLIELRRVDTGLGCELANALDRPERRVLRRGRQLVHLDHAGLVIDVDQVGEGSADVDTNPFHRPPSVVRTIFPKNSCSP